MWILLLRLEGPLQSWGERARWDYRDSSAIPTKSAVVGLLACALGLPREHPDIPALNRKLLLAVRADRTGTLMTDYQTVSGIIRTASGDQRGNKGEVTTIISNRQYLQDAAFLAALSGDLALLHRCGEALQNPVWPVFLGRKCCPATRPVFDCLTDRYNSFEDALARHPLATRRGKGAFLCEIEDTDGGAVRRDVRTGQPGRIYDIRRVRIHALPDQEVR